MTFVARPYQLKAHDLIVEAFKKQLKTLIVMPTGTGKTKTMISFMQKFSAYYNFVVVVRQRDLVFQFAEAIDEFEIDYGVVMSGHEKYDTKKSIQLCSIDTLNEREIYPLVNDTRDVILMIDEADETTSEKYDKVINRYVKRHQLAFPSHFTVEMMKKIRGAFLVGFTATAFDKPLVHFEKAIVPLTPDEALALGALVDFEYIIPKKLDLSDVKVIQGEFRAKDIDIKLNTPAMVKESFRLWQEHGQDRQTLIFVTSINHANKFAEYINAYYGREFARVITSEIDSSERKKLYTDFRHGKIRFLINIRIITRGVDIPEIGCILDCAPTLSMNLHVQKLGRGSRPNSIYKNCLVIDVANNCVNNGPFYGYPRPINLTENKKRSMKELMPLMDVCTNCFRASLKNPHSRKCPYCGTVYEVKEKKLTKAEAKKLEMESASPEKIKQLKMINDFKKILWVKANRRDQYSNNIDKAREAAHDELIKKYGIDDVLKIKNAIVLTGKFYERIKHKIYDDA